MSPIWNILNLIKLHQETKNTTSICCVITYLMYLTSWMVNIFAQKNTQIIQQFNRSRRKEKNTITQYKYIINIHRHICFTSNLGKILGIVCSSSNTSLLKFSGKTKGLHVSSLSNWILSKEPNWMGQKVIWQEL